MQVDSCYRIGYVMKKHGIQGAVKTRIERPLPENTESVFIEINKRLVPFFIVRQSIVNQEGIFWFEDVTTPDEADELASCSMYLPKTKFNDGDDQSPSDRNLLGFKVMHKSEELGIVEAVDSSSIIPLLKINSNGKEIIIPIQEHFVVNVDITKKLVDVVLPEGFFEI
ncbi:MAG: 16S rRNA processing protein RimM [Flammeovirgaceae bacterium]|nr:16S rRNA processing protein RimM [Flammeovirgaceae bacterium]